MHFSCAFEKKKVVPVNGFLSVSVRSSPKMHQTGAPKAIFGAIERALRNACTRKGRPIFDPTPGMTFDCLNEAQEFYNIYSWEVGFSTKKGDKYGKTMQEFQCQCHVREKLFDSMFLVFNYNLK